MMQIKRLLVLLLFGLLAAQPLAPRFEGAQSGLGADIFTFVGGAFLGAFIAIPVWLFTWRTPPSQGLWRSTPNFAVMLIFGILAFGKDYGHYRDAGMEMAKAQTSSLFGAAGILLILGLAGILWVRNGRLPPAGAD